jgi:hypothetical protein
MGEASTARLSARDWFLDRLHDGAPAIILRDDRGPGDATGDDDAALVGERPPVRVAGGPHDPDARPAIDVNAGAKRAALWLISAVLLLAMAIVAAFAVVGGGTDPAPPPQHRLTIPVVSAAPTSPPAARLQADRGIPFVAHTDSCSAGSTSPSALTDIDTDSAWVCARGPQESFLDGQVLHLTFTCESARPASTCSYMIHAVAVTPGWVAKTPGGTDEWLQHRVITAAQFNFFNGNQLAADPFYLSTNGIHGPVSATLPTTVLASRADVLILHTARPPAAPLPTGTRPTPGDALPTGDADPAGDPPIGGDPVDATFAMSRLQLFGHAPN